MVEPGEGVGGDLAESRHAWRSRPGCGEPPKARGEADQPGPRPRSPPRRQDEAEPAGGAQADADQQGCNRLPGRVRSNGQPPFPARGRRGRPAPGIAAQKKPPSSRRTGACRLAQPLAEAFELRAEPLGQPVSETGRSAVRCRRSLPARPPGRPAAAPPGRRRAGKVWSGRGRRPGHESDGGLHRPDLAFDPVAHPLEDPAVLAVAGRATCLRALPEPVHVEVAAPWRPPVAMSSQCWKYQPLL